MFVSGGGGFGDPREREPERVARDVEQGMVSIEAAARDYAVIVDPKTFKVNAEATAKLRQTRNRKTLMAQILIFGDSDKRRR